MADLDWNERAVPVLEAVYRAEENGDRPDPDEIAAEIGLEPDVTSRTVAALVEADYLRGIEATSLADKFDRYMALVLLERGRRAIGQWPPGPGDAFLVSLDRLIAAETDPDERSRLAKLRSAAADVGKQVLAGAIVAAGSAMA
jgi:DNA-binding MarR family transcriptional regulator